MDQNLKYFGLFFSLCLLIILTPGVSAGNETVMQVLENHSTVQPCSLPPQNNSTPPDFVNNSEFRDKIISDLESNGVNTSELKAAIASGDQEKSRDLMESLRDKFRHGPQERLQGNDTLGPGKERPPMGTGPGPQERMQGNDTLGPGKERPLMGTGPGPQERLQGNDTMGPGKERPPIDMGLGPQERMQGNGTMGPGKERPPMDMGPGPQEQPPGMKPGSEKPVEQTPQPTETKSPLSPFSVLAGITAAGCAVLLSKRL